MKTSRFYGKSTFSLLACTFLFSGIQQAQASLLEIGQSPLILTESVAPNLILTLDDSGSMRWAFAPDSYNVNHATRRAKSSTSNPMYYNPAVTYLLPVKVDAAGNKSATPYSTSFTNALNSGFRSAGGSLNLSSDYRVSWTYNPFAALPTAYGYSNTDPRLASNPVADFGPLLISSNSAPGTPTIGTYTATFTSNINVGQTRTVTNGGVTSTTTRLGTTTCSTVISTPTTTSAGPSTSTPNTPSQGYTTATTTQNQVTYPPVATCVRSGTTYTITAPTTVLPTITTTVNRGNLTQVGVPAYYYVYDTTLTGCSSAITDENCYKLVNVNSTSGMQRTDDVASGTDERQNFANWYSFYRNRTLATLSAANLAFNGVPGAVRLTWQDLSTCTTLNSANCGTNYIRKFSAQHRGNFFAWLETVNANGGTPLRAAMARAGEFLKTNDAWAANPKPLTSAGGTGTTVQGPEYACRPSYHIMMTDGIWTLADGVPSETLKPDHANSTLPDGKAYTQQRPFLGATTNTLADLAFHYWATDARSALANEVKQIIVAPNAVADTQYWDPRNDPASWQHMTTYTIGLGLGSFLSNGAIPWTGDTFGGAGYDALRAGTALWPAPSDNSPNNVYDLWHAAINSRGEFFSADSPDKIVDAFRDIINRISNRTATASAPAVVASLVGDDLTRAVYQTQFNSEDWSGDLIKYTRASGEAAVQVWSAKTVLDAQSSRNIKMFDASASSKLQDFTWSNLTAEQKELFNIDFDTTNQAVDTRGDERVAYLRGDRSGEGAAEGQFRERSTLLGDIINSAPVIVGTPKYLGYLADLIDGDSGDYLTFRDANTSELIGTETEPKRRPMIYVGANDGMLHGFDATTGEETFAYVPTAVLQNMYKLPGQRYKGGAHQYYVDGAPVVSDVYFDGGWHTVLVGTLRAGGRSLFALDITDPDDIKLLWEFSSAEDEDLGYSFPQPVMARLHTGNWAVLMANGYGNQTDTTSDKAALMILDVETGELVKKLVVTGDDTKANGLSSIKAADNNNDGVADYAYAGDLQGNLWRFDLIPNSIRNSTALDPFARYEATVNPSGIQDSSSYKDQFEVAYDDKPLYTAMDGRPVAESTAQAITAPPSLVRHPTMLGYIVVFGTGKYFETTDATVDDTRAQSMYGIWDRKTRAESTSAPTDALTRADLLQQSIIDEITNPFTTAANTLRVQSQEEISGLWYDVGATDTEDSSVNKWGWYFDLSVGNDLAGEMMINPMAARGESLLFSTLTPNEDPCQEGITAWIYGIDPFSGGRTKFNVFDINRNTIVDDGDTVEYDDKDTVISGFRPSSKNPGGFATNNSELFSTADDSMVYSPGPTSNGRQNWRVIPEEAQ
ncbi:MAG: PilC/PilY family type IV pilus protein [Pseudomonadota bacterium]